MNDDRKPKIIMPDDVSFLNVLKHKQAVTPVVKVEPKPEEKKNKEE
jgi:hypothetical protein